LLVFYFSTHERHFLVVSKVGHKPKIKLQYPIFMAFIVGACIDQSLGITSWAVANLFFRLQQQLGSWGTH
jgi:hypothetical protein